MFNSTSASPTSPGPDEHVWRYMDLARFVSMLSDRALHFVRADGMQDCWEGATGPLNRELRPVWYGEDWHGWLAETIPLLRPARRSLLGTAAGPAA